MKDPSKNFGIHTVCFLWKILMVILVLSSYIGLPSNLSAQTVLFQDWESGQGNWQIENDLWEIGTPVVGPSSCYSGSNCAGTVLDGNYTSAANTRLISPEVTLPTVSVGERIQLKFWQWFNIENGDDQGVLQITEDSGVTWQTISSVDIDGGNPVWSQYVADLTSYAGSSVRIGFYFTSNTDGTVYSGWYIDDVSIETGIVPFPNPEDFESGVGDWSADNGLWHVGEPTVGPPGTHSGTNCIGTVLDGNYTSAANTRLISPEVTLPTVSVGERIQLKFWQWFNIENGDDQGVLQITEDSGVTWQTISSVDIDGGNPVWSQYVADLTSYAGSSVRIGFYFTSNTDGTVYSGWYIDDVSIETGIVPFPNPEDFESGVGDWSADNGLWHVGEPTVGPPGTHSGTNCIGTVLDGNYTSAANTRLISPEITLPTVSVGERIQLKFWQWFNIENNDDQGVLQITEDSGVTWQTISSVDIDGGNPVWSQYVADLTSYAGSSVRIGFYFTSNTDGTVYSGWYIDDVSIETGIVPFPNPEDFESGVGDWSADNGLWHVGEPTVGPPGTHSGTNCIGTVLDGNYTSAANTRLISPEITLPTVSVGERIQLKFWQWFNIENNDDQGVLQITEDSGVTWQTISSVDIDGGNPVWSQYVADLTSYAGSSVRIGFYFTSNTDGTVYSGWYIDDVSIEKGIVPFPNPEDFESGVGDWSADNGLWHVGEPTVGPPGTHSGTNCIGTVLDGNYTSAANTRLISPEVTLPTVSAGEKIQLKFWQWFNIENNDDQGVLQITEDSGVTWQTISSVDIDGGNPVWSQYVADLTSYAGSSVRIGFYFTSNTDGTVYSGWYIDDVSIETGIVPFPNPEDFESGVGDWSADNGLWHVGEPTVGPPGTHSGTNCIGTVLDGNYTSAANTRLISPEITLPTVSAGEKIQLKFWQWFNIENNDDQGVLQITEDSGVTWQTISSVDIDGGNPVWSQYVADLTSYAGSSVRIGFYFTSNTDGTVYSGWYIDDVSIETGIVPFPNPEDFESGVGDWSADNGLWHVGEPTVGPPGTHSGTNCIGTVLDGNYTSAANTRLISPEITLTPLPGQSPMLSFYHWYVIENNDDKGLIQISVDGGVWQTVSDPITGNNEEWTKFNSLDLSAYINSSIRIGFYFTSNTDGTVYSGWYIDDINIDNLPITPYLTVTPSNRDVDKSAGQTTFEITSDLLWNVSENEDWLSADPISGSGNGTLTVTYGENSSSNERIGTISISGNDLTRNVTVTQSGDRYYIYTETEDYYSIIIENVTLNGQQIVDGDEVGVFFRDDNDDLVCGGAIVWPNTGMEAWGDDSQTPEKDGFVAGEELVFRLWDASDQMEYGPPVTVIYAAGNGTWGDGPYALISLMEFRAPCMITLEFVEGWNWISSNVSPFEPAVVDMWTGTTCLEILKSYGGFYVPGVWDGIGDWDYKQMYIAYLSCTENLFIEGQCIDPSEPIVLQESWNWVSYLPDQPIPIETSLVSIMDYLNIVKSYDGFFVPGIWDGIGDMVPGKGYKMHVSEECTLTYPPGGALTKPIGSKKSDPHGEICSYFGDFKTTEDYQALLIQSLKGNGIKPEDGDEIGIYTESGLCVGGTVVTDKYPLGMMAWMDDPRTEEVEGFKPGEQMVIKYWDDSEDKEYDVNTIVEDGSELLGESALTKVSLEVDLSDLESAVIPIIYSLQQNYPNPFNPETTIRYGIPEADNVKLILYSIDGQLVKELDHGFKEAGYHQVIWDGTNNSGESVSSGVYIYRMEAGTFSNVKKMVFLK